MIESIKYSSQEVTQNDKWVVHTLNFKTNGYFVEAGSMDGIFISNTYSLEKCLGWTGICVEPVSWMYSNLLNNRSCICENCCLYKESGKIEFVHGKKDGLGGIKKSIRHPHECNSENVENIICFTLEDLLIKHNSPKIIDYLSLDTEGSEQEILSVFPFSKYSFRCITVEDTAENYGISSLIQNGYVKVSNPFNLQNTWEHYYIRPDLINSVDTK